MKPIVTLFLTALLTGCALAGALPTVHYCDKVYYFRDGAEINIAAHCQAPAGARGVGIQLQP